MWFKSVVQKCVSSFCVHAGGVGPGEGIGDEEKGVVWNPGQWRDLPQPSGGAVTGKCASSLIMLTVRY